MNDEGMASIDPALLQRIRMNDELAQAMGGFHLRGWNAADGVIDAGFTVQRQHCHWRGASRRAASSPAGWTRRWRLP